MPVSMWKALPMRSALLGGLSLILAACSSPAPAPTAGASQADDSGLARGGLITRRRGVPGRGRSGITGRIPARPPQRRHRLATRSCPCVGLAGQNSQRHRGAATGGGHDAWARLVARSSGQAPSRNAKRHRAERSRSGERCRHQSDLPVTRRRPEHWRGKPGHSDVPAPGWRGA